MFIRNIILLSSTTKKTVLKCRGGRPHSSGHWTTSAGSTADQQTSLTGWVEVEFLPLRVQVPHLHCSRFRDFEYSLGDPTPHYLGTWTFRIPYLCRVLRTFLCVGVEGSHNHCLKYVIKVQKLNRHILTTIFTETHEHPEQAKPC